MKFGTINLFVLVNVLPVYNKVLHSHFRSIGSSGVTHKAKTVLVGVHHVARESKTGQIRRRSDKW